MDQGSSDKSGESYGEGGEMTDTPKADTSAAAVERAICNPIISMVADGGSPSLGACSELIDTARALAAERDTLRAALQAGPKVKPLVWVDEFGDASQFVGSHGSLVYHERIQRRKSGMYHYNGETFKRLDDAKSEVQRAFVAAILSALGHRPLKPNGGE